MANTWRYEIYSPDGKFIMSRERQTFEQVWYAAIDSTAYEKLEFSAPPDAPQSEIDRLTQLGTVRPR